MSKKLNDVFAELSPKDGMLLSGILELEKRHLPIQDMKNNLSREKQVLTKMEKMISKAVRDED
jgi:hypothetical protein